MFILEIVYEIKIIPVLIYFVDQPNLHSKRLCQNHRFRKIFKFFVFVVVNRAETPTFGKDMR